MAILIGVSTVYQWSPEQVERDWVVFPLWPGYGSRPAEAHTTVLRLLLEAGKGSPVEILDHTGSPWEFYTGTVSSLQVWAERERGTSTYHVRG